MACWCAPHNIPRKGITSPAKAAENLADHRQPQRVIHNVPTFNSIGCLRPILSGSPFEVYYGGSAVWQ